MEVDECIRTRRSIRKYSKKSVKDELICEIIDASRFAPSAGNLQNWKVIILTDKKKREDLTKACLNQSWMTQAPVHLVICDNIEKVKSYYSARGSLYCVQGCAMLAQNILLKAHSLGLGSCIVATFDPERIRRILEIPESVNPEMVITLGYPEFDKRPTPPKRYPLELITYFEKWGKKSVSVDKRLNAKQKRVKEKLNKGKSFIKEKLGLK